MQNSRELMARQPSSTFRWWLATSISKPSHVLGYGEAMLTASQEHALRIVGESDTLGFINEIKHIAIESNTNTLMILEEGHPIRLYPQSQVTPGTERVYRYWFTYDGNIVTFEDIDFDRKNQFGRLNQPLTINGEFNDRRKINTERPTKVFNIVDLDGSGTCFAVCGIDDNIRKHFILESPVGRQTAATHKAATAATPRSKTKRARVATALFGAY